MFLIHFRLLPAHSFFSHLPDRHSPTWSLVWHFASGLTPVRPAREITQPNLIQTFDTSNSDDSAPQNLFIPQLTTLNYFKKCSSKHINRWPFSSVIQASWVVVLEVEKLIGRTNWWICRCLRFSTAKQLDSCIFEADANYESFDFVSLFFWAQNFSLSSINTKSQRLNSKSFVYVL